MIWHSADFGSLVAVVWGPVHGPRWFCYRLRFGGRVVGWTAQAGKLYVKIHWR